ncbi:hypothetical protein BC2230_60087 [Burkholderia cepacia]
MLSIPKRTLIRADNNATLTPLLVVNYLI